MAVASRCPPRSPGRIDRFCLLCFFTVFRLSSYVSFGSCYVFRFLFWCAYACFIYSFVVLCVFHMCLSLSYINVEELKNKLRDEIMPIAKKEVEKDAITEGWRQCMAHIQASFRDPKYRKGPGRKPAFNEAPVTPASEGNETPPPEGDEMAGSSLAGTEIPGDRPEVPLPRHPFCGRHWWGQKPRNRGSPYPTPGGKPGRKK